MAPFDEIDMLFSHGTEGVGSTSVARRGDARMAPSRLRCAALSA
jgi:hypothetical protein